jgi:hypothetical protein
MSSRRLFSMILGLVIVLLTTGHLQAQKDEPEKTKRIGEGTKKNDAEVNPAAGAASCAACGGTMLFFFVVIPIGLLILHIFLLVWVAKDAKARNMDSSVVWMAVVLLFGVVGFAIYIFSRPKGDLMKCRSCGNKRLVVSRLCPHCGNSGRRSRDEDEDEDEDDEDEDEDDRRRRPRRRSRP